MADSLWRNRDFALLWTGQALSALGGSLAAIAYPLLALAATGSVSQAGLVAFAGLAVNALMLLPAGVLTDRLPRKPLLVVSDLVRAVTTAAVVAGAILALMYFAATPANALIMTLLLDRTPAGMHGRVVSSAMFAATCATPAGPLIVGLLYDAYGQLPTFLTFAVATAGITLAMYRSGALRSLGREQPVRET